MGEREGRGKFQLPGPHGPCMDLIPIPAYSSTLPNATCLSLERTSSDKSQDLPDGPTTPPIISAFPPGGTGSPGCTPQRQSDHFSF